MKKLFACALLTAAVSLPALKVSADVVSCADYCFQGDYSTICQDDNGNRMTCFEYLYHWPTPPQAQGQ